MTKLRKMLCIVIAGLALSATAVISVSAVQKQTIYNSPYVTFAPDGKAWTTNAGEQNIEWYEEGTIVSTGISSGIRTLQTGEHYYLYNRTGEIPIGRWEVSLSEVNCCHNGYPDESKPYHGIAYNRNLCLKDHYSGWFSYCADCGQEIYHCFFYMSQETAESIDFLEVGTGMEYYYLCPFCDNLEQGTELAGHECKAISFNQYEVIYNANTIQSYGGYMANSYHMYNNAAEYNGETVIPITHLTENAYTQIGYEFVEWNTEPDGSGTSYQDGQEILNLSTADYQDASTWTEDDKGSVILYAQWRKSFGTLRINPNGGRYNGKSAVTTVTGSFGNSYSILSDTIVAPMGYTVSFNTNGGKAVASITGTRYFREWIESSPFNGRIKDEVYYFIAPNGNTDTIVANYGWNSITLPSTSRTGYSFGGWYYDSEFTKPAGGPGDKITPSKDMTLYAAWVDLKLTSVDNYTSNGGRGAVDLSWSQADSNNKVYKLYQSRDNAAWKLITSANDIANPTAISQSFAYSGRSKTYTVPYSGIYTLNAKGAQGGDYGSYKGGKGGSVTACVWLEKGEVITYTIGGRDGYNGGGTGSVFGNGGGSTTIVSNIQGTLLIAGGGGGAGENGTGGAGGSSANLRSDNKSAGANGQAGGGAGYVGGNAGEHIVHNCDDDCYTTTSGTNTAKKAFYSASTITAVNNMESYGMIENVSATSIDFSTYSATSSAEEIATGNIIVGDSSAYLSTPESGNLTFTVSNAGGDYDGVWNKFDETNFTVTVYDKDTDKVIYKADTANLEHTEESSSRLLCDLSTCTLDYHSQQIDTWTYNASGSKGSATGSRVRSYYISWYDHDGESRGQVDTDITELSFTVPIPEDTEGIYIQCAINVSGCQDGAQYGLTVRDISYSYESRTKTCGYTDGQVISSKPAYGGSNYINTTVAYEYSHDSGNRSGNGAFSIKSESLGYLDMLSLKDVIARDYAAPDSIDSQSVTKESVSGTRVKVSWQEPADNGTDYYHMAESYLVGSTSMLCRSNVTKNTPVSGIKGYYVLTNTSSSTTVNATNGSFISGRSQTVSLGTQVKYMHIAAVDVAENIGSTVHVKIDAKDIAWKLYTEQLVIEEAENVYPAGEDKTWYVRADESTAFTMQNQSYMDGTATENYQPNYIIYESVMDGITAQNIVRVPSVTIQNKSLRTDAEGLTHSTEGQSMLSQYPYSYAVRSNSNRKLLGVQSFMLSPEASGKRIELTPRAGADSGEEILYSNRDADRGNRITIIGDGEEPVINGLELLESLELINRNEGSLTLNVTATDTISGIREFYLEITNTDNGNYKKYSANAENRIQIEITQDQPIFSGDFTVHAYAVDNVGNEAEVNCATTEFALTATLERILEPHEPIFKCGESGILTLSAYGYAEKIEVIFPPEMTALQPELNQVFDYSGNASYLQREEIQFMIPLYTPANTQYTITVRAYKGDKRLEEHPTFSTIAVEGSVLDEFRTRLR